MIYVRNYLYLAVLMTFSTITWAEIEPSQRLEHVQTKIHNLSKDFDQAKASKTALYQQLKTQSQLISKLNRELHFLEQEIQQQTAQLNVLKQQHQQQRQTHAQQLTALNKQLRAAYISAQPRYLQVLLNQREPVSSGRTSTYFRYFHHARQQQLATINTTLQTLAIDQQQLLAARQHQQQLFDQRQQQQLALKQTNQQRLATLKQLEKKLDTQKGQIVALRREEHSLQALFKSLSQQRQSQLLVQRADTEIFSNLKGMLAWPIKGKVVAHYGSPRNLGKLTWQGMMIKTSSGNNVTSAAAGQVVFSDWLRGFGLLMIIDHGDKYMTLYGNNQTLLKVVGDTVHTGEIIALSGDKGIRQYAGLYFELRHNGSPTNPEKWLSKQS